MSIFLIAFAAAGLAISAWTIATPLMAAPDEPYHVVQAAALVRGQFDRPYHRIHPGLVSTVRVPYWVQTATVDVNCIAFNPKVSASCQPPVSDKTKLVGSLTSFSHSPPLYYALTGLPSLFVVGAKGIYAMRLAGAAVNAGLIALGFFLLLRYHPRRSTLVGGLVALAPMVLFLSGVVNSSGMETAAGFAAWCGGLCLVEQTRVPRALAMWTALGFAILILSRPISPVYAAVLAVVLGFFAGWRKTRELLRDRSVQLAGAGVGLAVVIAGIFLARDGYPALLGYPVQPRVGPLSAVHLTLRLTGPRLLQTIGDFGWLDTPAPHLTKVIWIVAVAALVVLGLAMSARCRRALPVLALAIVAMPVLFEAPKLNASGTYWQGRYWLPLIVGVPLLASTALGRIPALHSRRSPAAVIAVLTAGLILGVAQLAAFLTALHRYETGVGPRPHPWPPWSPPGGSAFVIAIFVAGEALLIGLAVWAVLAFRGGRGRGRRGMPAAEWSSA